MITKHSRKKFQLKWITGTNEVKEKGMKETENPWGKAGNFRNISEGLEEGQRENDNWHHCT